MTKTNIDLFTLFAVAQEEPVRLITEDGHKFVLLQMDEQVDEEFEAEVEALRNSPSFQAFLDERMKTQPLISIEEVEQKINAELSLQGVMA
ncbi:MAG: hypothetical protein U0350_02985 [Caldilineaceae bacterium]